MKSPETLMLGRHTKILLSQLVVRVVTEPAAVSLEGLASVHLECYYTVQ